MVYVALSVDEGKAVKRRKGRSPFKFYQRGHQRRAADRNHANLLDWLLAIYTDYLISTSAYVTATGLSAVLDGEYQAILILRVNKMAVLRGTSKNRSERPKDKEGSQREPRYIKQIVEVRARNRRRISVAQ